MKPILYLYTACLITFLLGTSATSRADDQDGGDLAWKYHCLTCHGEQGVSNQWRYPHIAGQPSAYLESRLKYFRSGAERGNKMNAQAAPLSDAEVQILSDHYAQMTLPAQPGLNAEALITEKGCVACHGVDGVATAPIYPNLRGQWVKYLQVQLRAYRSGARQNAIMNGFAASLTDEEIRAIARHYGQER